MSKKKFIRTISLLLCLTMAVMLVACGGKKDSEDASSEEAKSVTIGLTAEAVNTIPVEYVDDATTWVTQIMYLPLMQLDDDLVYKPMLAESVETEDYKNFTVKLNPDAKWTDGKPVTADDVVFTMDMIANPETKSTLASFITILEGVDEAGLIADGTEHVSGVEKVDDTTVIFTTKEKTGIDVFNDTVSRRLSPIPKHLFEGTEPADLLKNEEFTNPTVTSGPYTLVSFEKGASAEFVANKDYFLGAPNIEKLNIKIVESENLVTELQNGSIDMNCLYGAIPTTDYELVREMEGITAIDGKMMNMTYLYTNTEIVSDARIRQAISMAIDREQIIESCFPGYGETTVMPFPNDFKYLNKELAKPEFDQEAAKALVEEAGWTLDRPLTVITYNQPEVAQIIAQNLTDIGIPTEVEQLDWGTLSDRMFSVDYDFVMMNDSFTATNTVSNLLFMYADGSNYNNYKNDELAALVNKIPGLSDEEEIAENYNAIQEIVAEEVPSPSLYCTSKLLAVNNRVTEGGPKTFGMLIDIQDWDVK